MPTTQPAEKPKTTRHRINEVPGRTTPAPGQPQPVKQTPAEKRAQLADLKATVKEIDKKKKVDQMIEMMRRPQGASGAELVDLTGWKDHSVRAFISRNLKGLKGLPVTRKKDGLNGVTVYSLPPADQVAAETEEFI